MSNRSSHRHFTVKEKLRLLADRIRARRLAGKVVNPIPGWPVTYKYGVKNPDYQAGHHTGEDHSTSGQVGIPVVAVSPGRVVAADWGAAYGTHVVIEMLDSSYRYGYCHLSRSDVAWNERVETGQVIGLSGNTGNSSGPHLHFEAREYPFRYGDDVHPIRVKKKVL